jgi:8-oxo-dGTP pyrophosphatase MutT (NUDIX family)
VVLLNLIFDKNYITKKLKSFNSQSRLCLQDEDFIKSAILFLIIPNKDRPYDLVLIRRTHRDRDKHAGEMSFPGGLFDTQLDKSYQDTALRETEEELGILRSDINILGCLDDHITPKKFIITPFVGYVDTNQKMIKNDEEVQEIVKISIDFFANEKNYKERVYNLKENTIAVGKYNYRNPNNKKYVIFGATTHIIVSFIELVYDIKLMQNGARRLICSDFK